MQPLPTRRGPRPAVSEGIPQSQLDQTPPEDLYQEARARLLGLPGTVSGPSLISVPGAEAVFLQGVEGTKDCAACRDVFLRGTEFAHIHPPVDGSFHMVLDEEDCKAVLRGGWGVRHPWSASGRILPGVMLVYAPRDREELETIVTLTKRSLARAERHRPHCGELS